MPFLLIESCALSLSQPNGLYRDQGQANHKEPCVHYQLAMQQHQPTAKTLGYRFYPPRVHQPYAPKDQKSGLAYGFCYIPTLLFFDLASFLGFFQFLLHFPYHLKPH